MAKEQEVSILGIDKERIIHQLTILGAEKVLDTHLTVDWFRLTGVREGEDPWYLRIRTNSSGITEVTWKGRSQMLTTSRSHKEINFPIGHPKEMEDLFLSIGLEKYAHQEKDRISWIFKDWRFDLDTYPSMPPYLEVEGTSDDHIREAMILLGLENYETWNRGERILIQEKFSLDWYNMYFDKQTEFSTSTQ